ncbi:MAG: phosphomethylpyrimidine synthase, partial [Archaeoglobi archaeon]
MSLIEEAKKGIKSELIEKVSEYEGVEADKIVRLVAKGHVIIPKNVLREVEPRAIG